MANPVFFQLGYKLGHEGLHAVGQGSGQPLWNRHHGQLSCRVRRGCKEDLDWGQNIHKMNFILKLTTPYGMGYNI